MGLSMSKSEIVVHGPGRAWYRANRKRIFLGSLQPFYIITLREVEGETILISRRDKRGIFMRMRAGHQEEVSRSAPYSPPHELRFSASRMYVDLTVR